MRQILKWTLLGCSVLYLLAVLQGFFIDRGIIYRSVQIGLYAAILTIAAYLIFTWIWPRTN